MGILYLAIVSLIWALSFGLIGNKLAGLDSFFVAATRLGLAWVVFLPFFRLGTLRKSDFFRLFGCGAIQFGLMYVCYIQAYRYLPSHLVALFSILTPLYVVLIHDLRQRKWTPLYFAVAALSVLGAAVIKATGVSSGGIWTGFALMQVAGLAFAYGQVDYRSWKRAHPKVRDSECFALLYAGGFSLALVVSLGATDWSQLAVSPKQWSVLAYLGVVASGGGFFLWNKGAARSNPGTLAAFNNAVVPLAMFASLFLFGEIGEIDGESVLRLTAGTLFIAAAVVIGARGRTTG